MKGVDMNVSLPPALKGFIEKKVSEGLYQSESDVISDALRGLRERDYLLSRSSASQEVKRLPLSSAQLAAVEPELVRLKDQLSKVEVTINNIVQAIERLRSQDESNQEGDKETQDMAKTIMKSLQKAADSYDEILHSIFG
jgi:putative addiction module CopG family antidote